MRHAPFPHVRPGRIWRDDEIRCRNPLIQRTRRMTSPVASARTSADEKILKSEPNHPALQSIISGLSQARAVVVAVAKRRRASRPSQRPQPRQSYRFASSSPRPSKQYRARYGKSALTQIKWRLVGRDEQRSVRTQPTLMCIKRFGREVPSQREANAYPCPSGDA